MSAPENPTGDRPDPDVLAALRQIQALVSAVERYVELARREHHLGRSDVQALNALAQAEITGTPMTAGQMSERLVFSSAATSTLLDRLVQADHIRREKDPADKRRTVIAATPSARETGFAMMRPMIRRMAEVMAQVPEHDRATLVTTLTALVDAARLAQQDATDHSQQG